MSAINTFIKLSIPTFFEGQVRQDALNLMEKNNIGVDNPAYQTICTDWVTAEVLEYIASEGNVENWSTLYIID